MSLFAHHLLLLFAFQIYVVFVECLTQVLSQPLVCFSHRDAVYDGKCAILINPEWAKVLSSFSSFKQDKTVRNNYKYDLMQPNGDSLLIFLHVVCVVGVCRATTDIQRPCSIWVKSNGRLRPTSPPLTCAVMTRTTRWFSMNKGWNSWRKWWNLTVCSPSPPHPPPTARLQPCLKPCQPMLTFVFVSQAKWPNYAAWRGECFLFLLALFTWMLVSHILCLFFF